MMPYVYQISPVARPKVIAAIPCFNTETSVTSVVANAKKYVDQVIVIDDGSHDGTAKAAEAAGAIVMKHGINTGYGGAVRSCFEVARSNGADALVILDGDGQHNPDEIPLLLDPLLRGDADLIIGSRFLNGQVNMPRYRKFGISVITLLFNLGSRKVVSDAQSGFRSYGRELLHKLSFSENGMGISIEILEKARREEATMMEVPISCYYEPSTLNWKAIKHGLDVALSVIRIRLKSIFYRLSKKSEDDVQ